MHNTHLMTAVKVIFVVRFHRPAIFSKNMFPKECVSLTSESLVLINFNQLILRTKNV